MARADIDRLRSVKTLAQLMTYLRDELDWPIGSDDVEDVTFTYDPAELGFNTKATVHIKDVKQLRPLHAKQPWGVFWVNFEKKRLPVVMLRRALGHLVVKKRAAAGRADQKAWRMNDLLFISAYGEDHDRAITFAHFSQDQGTPGELPVLKVISWDDADTVLHVADVHRELTEKLRWPSNPADVSEWRQQWADAFTLRHGEVIKTTELLVDELARLATNIRNAVLFAVSRETDKGPWRRMLIAFQGTLIRGLTEESFADVIAQTVSYGLLTARFSASGAITLRNLVDMVPRTNPFLKELLGHFLSSAGRHGLFDVDEVGIDEVVSLLNFANAEAIKHDFGNKTSGEDPVIHFYEHFLGAYNKQLKVERGVFYTPQPVVGYIVRCAHELLQTEFGLADGLADTITWAEMMRRHPGLKLPPLTDEPDEKRTISPDEPFVQILDPATGTATFLVEVIDVIYRTLAARWKEQRLNDVQQRAAWNDYVPQHLLPRLHAFELMMAPYAIAHMKIGLKLAETGYSFGKEERARIYLTNALEPWVKQLPLVGFDALAHEAAAVNEIKRNKRFTVVIGNPPYSGESSNNGEWISSLIRDYHYVDGQPLGEANPRWLQDDYVKFIRLAQWAVATTGSGVVSVITNHAYLDNATFRGARQSLLATFPRGWFLDLHGNTKKKERHPDGSIDVNVFEIQQGVAISILARTEFDLAGQVEHGEIFGTREAKNDFLGRSTLSSTEWHAIKPIPPFYLFIPQDQTLFSEYQSYFKITEAMPLHSNGVVTARDHLCIGWSAEEVWNVVREFAEMRPEKARTHFDLGEDSRDWQVKLAQADLNRDGPSRKQVIPIYYRPFDTRWTYFTGRSRGYLCMPRGDSMSNMLTGKNVALITSRMTKGETFQHVQSTRSVSEAIVMSPKTSNNGFIFPLYLLPDSREADRLAFRPRPELNFAPAFLRQLAARLELTQTKPHGVPAGLAPEDIFHYTYAVFHSPGYRRRYGEFLTIDFPRLPLPGNLEVLRALAGVGSELVALHLLESPGLDQGVTEYLGARAEVEKVSWSKNTVWIDKAQSIGFKGVREDVWNFHVGGYKVCEKWLKDRKGRKLSKDDIAHYQKVVVALSETIRLMKEVDKVIEKQGGWPGAFSPSKSKRDVQ